jgi:hypothetical protein
MRTAGAFVAVLLAAVPIAAQTSAPRPAAAEIDPAVRPEVEHIRTWTQDAALLQAVREQNALNVPLSRIRSIDITWMTEGENNTRAQALLKNPCAKSLQALAAARPGYREAFVMDNQGALVCMTRKTSDYWQGDEDKWRKPFVEGRAAFVDEPALDASSATYAIQMSVPVLEGAQRIGALALTLKVRKDATAAGR